MITSPVKRGCRDNVRRVSRLAAAAGRLDDV